MPMSAPMHTGGHWVVFTRCSSYPIGAELLGPQLPGRHCSIRAYRFGTNREVRVTGPTAPSSLSLQSPALADGRVYVARLSHLRHHRRTLRVAEVPLSGGRLRTLRGGAVAAFSVGATDAVGRRFDVITAGPGARTAIWQYTLGGQRHRLYQQSTEQPVGGPGVEQVDPRAPTDLSLSDGRTLVSLGSAAVRPSCCSISRFLIGGLTTLKDARTFDGPGYVQSVSGTSRDFIYSTDPAKTTDPFCRTSRDPGATCQLGASRAP